MLDSIYVAMTGLQGYSQGLRVIANNMANMNTPGYKSSSLQFADLFYNTQSSGSGLMQTGYGLTTNGTRMNFSQGSLRQTGNPLDLALDGQGLFTLMDANGNLHYTRAGQFMFNADGVLVSSDGSKVMGIDANGALGEITTTNQGTLAGKATSTVKFTGNISSDAPTQTINGVKVIDSLGGEHLLTVVLTKGTDPGDGSGTPWTVQLKDGDTVVGTGSLTFTQGRPDAATAKVAITYTPADVPAMPLTLDFGTDVTSFAAGSLSTVAVASQDGYGPGALTGVSVDNMGVVVMSYSNGQTVKGSKLALGRFDSPDSIEAAGGNAFDTTTGTAGWHTGTAGSGGFGSVHAGMVELSNVDLTQEFSDMIIMQRGYQASSQVISTANEMLQELFNMKGK